MELHMKRFSDPKTLTFGVWDLKTSLGQFGSRAFGKALIKPVVENPAVVNKVETCLNMFVLMSTIVLYDV